MKRLIRSIAIVFMLVGAMNVAWADAGSSTSFFDRVKSKVGRIVVEAKEKAREVKQDIVKWYYGDTPEKVAEKKPEIAPVQETRQPASDNPVASSAPVAAPTMAQPDLKGVISGLKAQGGLTVETPARAGDKTLTRNKQGVVSLPKFVKNIPKLDIGDEERLNYQDLIGDKTLVKPLVVAPFPKLATPEVVAKSAINAVIPKKIPTVGEAGKNISEVKGQDFPVTKEKIESVTFLNVEPTPAQELPVKLLSDNEKTLLAALILNSTGKSCHNVVGLLRDIEPSHAGYAEAKYVSAKCLKEMGLGSQKLTDLKEVLGQSDKEFGTKAVGLTGTDSQYAYEGDIGQMLKSGISKFGVDDEDKNAVSFTLAKIYTREGQYEAAIREASAVKTKSEYYTRAQFIIMMSQYLKGESKASLETGKQLSQYLAKNGDPQKLATMVNMNMGRIYAHSRSYDEALKNYLKIEKSHPLWVEGLLEQGWVQINSGDYVGAVGNMFSIQTGFFRNIYQPESYAVRAIGYLNICQYGDAHRTVEVFEKIHRPWLAKLETYLSANTKGSFYYETLKKHLRDPKQPIIDGLPFQIVREMGRHKDFLNIQEGLNGLIDEIDQWSFLEKFFGKDIKRLSSELSQATFERKGIQARILRLQENKTQIDEVANLKRSIRQYETKEVALKFKIDLVTRAQTNFAKAKKEGIKLIGLKRDGMRGQAEKVLAKRLKEVRDELKELFSNNDLLRFEIYSGSGENIRFQVAGGEKGGVKTPDAIKENSKNLNWEFDGEVWEDEIGNFRSTLQNNCPKEKAAEQVYKEKSKNAGL